MDKEESDDFEFASAGDIEGDMCFSSAVEFVQISGGEGLSK